jgi:hypothetical protein
LILTKNTFTIPYWFINVMYGGIMRSVYIDGVYQSLDIQTKRMVGEVMTLLEASLEETPATLALKKSIKQTIWRTNRSVQEDLNSMSFKDMEE